MHIAPSRIFEVLGKQFPAVRINANWPLIAEALERRNVSSLPCEIAAVATIAVETSTFSPVKERGGPAYLRKLYWDDEQRRHALGNCVTGDGHVFCARGFIPLRGRANYQTFGNLVGMDLVTDPWKALDPAIGAELLAAWFWMRDINRLATEGQWEAVRRRVSGNLSSWSDFCRIVMRLNEVN